jgi:RNA polymerase sigma-70 factor (ECF subfamily)
MTDRDLRSARLMEAMALGDALALRELVSIWEAPLLRFAYRYLQDETEARDVAQETLVRLHESRARYRPGRAFSGWLFTIAANCCRNQLRRRRRHALLSLDWLLGKGGAEAEPVSGQPCPATALVESERVRAVRAAIEELPHKLKTTLLLHEYEDFGYAEIARVEGCSEKGVEARLRRARERLRERLAGLRGNT